MTVILHKSLISRTPLVYRFSLVSKFYVNAVWDEEAKVFYTRSNIKGLHLEAKTLQKFSDAINEYAPDQIRAMQEAKN